MNARNYLEADALRSFAEFADRRNFTAAAEALHISQPSLHVKVRNLSQALGVKLYERHGRTLSLTPAGEALARLARDAQVRVDDFLAEVAGERPAAPMVVAAGRGAHLYVIGEGLRRWLRADQGLRVISSNRRDTLNLVRTGRADVGVAVFDPPPDDLETVELAAYPQTLVVREGHPLAGNGDLGLRDLEGLDLVVPPPERPHRRALARALADVGVRWRVAVEAEGWDLLVHFVRLGLGASVVNGCVQVPGGLLGIPIRDLPPVRYFCLYRGARAARAAPLIEILRDTVP